MQIGICFSGPTTRREDRLTDEAARWDTRTDPLAAAEPDGDGWTYLVCVALISLVFVIAQSPIGPKGIGQVYVVDYMMTCWVLTSAD